jgi:hypothetical protein
VRLPVYALDEGRSILEFDASTGAFVRTISGPQFQLEDNTGAITLVGGDNLIVPSLMGVATGNDPLKDQSYLTEINASTGALVKVVRQLPYRFGNIMAMVPDGPDLYVLNQPVMTNQAPSIVELNTSTWALVRVISGAQYKLNDPFSMTLSEGKLFVANSQGAFENRGSVTEIDASTGALARVMAGPAYRLVYPFAVQADGSDLFVLNATALKDPDEVGSVTELSAATGQVVNVYSGATYDFVGADALAVSGNELFVTNSDGGASPAGYGSVTELRV